VLETFQHAHVLLLILLLYPRCTEKYSSVCGFVCISRISCLPYLLAKESCEKQQDWQHHSGQTRLQHMLLFYSNADVVLVAVI